MIEGDIGDAFDLAMPGHRNRREKGHRHQAGVNRNEPLRASVFQDFGIYSGKRGENGLRRQRAPRLPRRSGRAYARRHLFAACRRRSDGEPGGGPGGSHFDAELLPHRPVLPEQGRTLPEVLPRSAENFERSLSRIRSGDANRLDRGSHESRRRLF